MSDNSKNPQFVIAKAHESAAPRTIMGVLPIDTYLVQFKDTEGQESVRIVFAPKGAQETFILAERLHGDAIAVAATKWFNKAFLEFINKASKGDGNEVESV